jgi:hypothetical protein
LLVEHTILLTFAVPDVKVALVFDLANKIGRVARTIFITLTRIDVAENTLKGLCNIRHWSLCDRYINST